MLGFSIDNDNRTFFEKNILNEWEDKAKDKRLIPDKIKIKWRLILKKWLNDHVDPTFLNMENFTHDDLWNMAPSSSVSRASLDGPSLQGFLSSLILYDLGRHFLLRIYHDFHCLWAPQLGGIQISSRRPTVQCPLLCLCPISSPTHNLLDKIHCACWFCNQGTAHSRSNNSFGMNHIE